jgi:regulator of ribosome biosynthesis
LTLDADYDPSKEARAARKVRMAKNERQRMQNLSRTQQGQTTSPKAPIRGERTREIEHTLATTRVSTASMGRFDRTLEGEKKPRGMKRKVRVYVPTLISVVLDAFCVFSPVVRAYGKIG